MHYRLPPIEPIAWGSGEPNGLVQEACFGSESSYNAPQHWFWGYIRCPRGAARTGSGYSTVGWSEALDPSESITWRPGLIGDHATTPYEVRSKTIPSWVPYISYKPPIFGVHPRSAGPRNRQSAQNRLAGIRGILMRCRGTHGDQLRRLP